MDTQVTNRRSIPTELKPRIRYAGQLNRLAKYTLPLTEWNKLTRAQRGALGFVMGVPSVDAQGIITYYAWPPELIIAES